MNEDDIKETADNTAEEPKSAISADLIRGHINTIILRTLYERDKYGYEIIEEIDAKSHGQYTLKQPTLYSALKRLESQGYVNAYWKTDEVSNGGRRKYYTLTDSGREITETNRAEWEYSRTVIDNLISDRSFDFTQPPPAAVDFKILKNSTSRVPVVKEETDETPVREIKIEEPAATETVEKIEVQPVQPVVPVESIYTLSTEDKREIKDKVAEAASEVPAATVVDEEQRKRVHENYLKLISEPVETPTETPPTPYAEKIDTEKLIYNNKPETERDYRNLINTLFNKTVSQRVAPAQPIPAEPRRGSAPTVRYEDVTSKAHSDGLTVNTSEYTVTGSRRKKYNRGATLFKCSLFVAVLMMLEFAFSLIFRKELGVGYSYPFIIFAIACAQVLIFGILLTTDYGKSARKPTSITYLTASVIMAVIAILIIVVVSPLTVSNYASAGDIMAKIVIPCLVVLNIPIFSLCFYLLNKYL